MEEVIQRNDVGAWLLPSRLLPLHPSILILVDDGVCPFRPSLHFHPLLLIPLGLLPLLRLLQLLNITPNLESIVILSYLHDEMVYLLRNLRLILERLDLFQHAGPLLLLLLPKGLHPHGLAESLLALLCRRVQPLLPTALQSRLLLH